MILITGEMLDRNVRGRTHVTGLRQRPTRSFDIKYQPNARLEMKPYRTNIAYLNKFTPKICMYCMLPTIRHQPRISPW